MTVNKLSGLLLMICSFVLYGQAYESTIPGLNITAPTASGIASKIKSPSAISTGIPDIGIPFFTLPTHNKNVSINIGLSYHPNNTFMGSKASDVGLGWNVAGASNVIYREINPANGVPTDKYHFNFLGKTGSFQFRDMELSKITENIYRISATEIGTNLYSFKIIDEHGISYYFDILDNSYYFQEGNGGINKPFTGCYYLSRIENLQGDTLITFEYQQDNYTVPRFINTPTYMPIAVKSLKPSIITSVDFGSIHFDYTFNPNNRKSYQDPFQLNFIELKNKAGKKIEKFVIQSSETSIDYPIGLITEGPYAGCLTKDEQPKRLLFKILKYGTGSTFETTEIKYPMFYPGNNFDFLDYWTEYPNTDPSRKCFREEYKNPKYLGIGLLQSIKYPNGSEVKYTFEPNQYYVDKSNPDYAVSMPVYEVKDREAQYYEDVLFYPFDVPSGTTIGNFTLPHNPDLADGYSYLLFHLAVGELYTNDPFQTANGNYFINGALTGGIDGENGHKKYPPGQNTFSITGTGGKGTVIIKRVRYKSLPAENYITGNGVRIKKIEYLKNNVVEESLTKNFEYKRFDGTNKTSGYLNNIENVETVVYKNVKETTGVNQGYIKYYYRTLFDKTETPINSQDSLIITGNEMRYANILLNGLLEKKEIYDKNDLLIQKDTIISAMRSLNSSHVTVADYYGLTINVIRNGIVQNQKIFSTNYSQSGNYTNISETIRDINNFNIIYEKITGADGTVTESNITYPFGRSNRLWNANIRTIPVIVETKRNGTVISKGETKFENASHFYPTSQISFLPDNLSQSLQNVSYDIYDDKGNLVQFTAFPEVGSAGVPTTIIYGYNKTMPIAKIEGAKLSDIPSSLITAIVNASNDDANAPAAQEEAKEQALIAALNTFKNDAALENFMVTCYTYNPLVGITTTIPPNGMMELYKYDSFNRLLKVVDVNGNTVKEHQYNYKQ
ncbi:MULTISPECIES: hypothetical protein [Chryseobacterium]|uniref:YD repeat-containing protein n=1 Tax=Chryseobacterium taihuense TaxID=1141221 RepID=A0A4V6IDI6_9FLAO|nr:MULTISPECIES: hypothetical protein [Chryseobacterium]QQV03070.1 hypothetical protein I6I61_01545 [Chryseobacterium sp. FDAARGOS 1104]VFB03634.1 Uncharacterised protein [Chryseobacterium taihuense]